MALSRLLAFLLFGALSVWWTWPLATRLSSRVASDPGDPFLNAWILWWNANAVPFTDGWWNPPIFYPMRGALALSEHLAGIGFFTTPVIILGGSPALAYNLALLASCALSGFFTYLLVRRLTGSTVAAACAGVAYAIAPVRAGQLSHLQVLTSQWLPVMLHGLHVYLETGRRRWLAVFAIAWALQSLSNGYYLLFAPVLIAAWIAWFLLARRRWRDAGRVLAAWVAGSIPLAPVILEYRAVHGSMGLYRPRSQILAFSGTLESYLKAPPTLAFWPEPSVPSLEDMLFPGLTIVLVILVALPWAGRRTSPCAGESVGRVFLFYVLAALLTAAFTFGPAAPGDGVLGWLKPYQWLTLLPGFDGVRVPARFAMLTALSLAVSGGVGLAAILPAHRTWRAAAGVVVLAGLVVDGAMEPMTTSLLAGRVDLPKVPVGAVLEFPPDDFGVSVGAMFRAMSHRLPLINGYSGHIPPHYDILGKSLRRDDPSAIVELARGRSLLLLIAERNDPAGSFRKIVEAIPGVERREVTSAGTSYLLPAQPRERRPLGGTVNPFTASWEPRAHVVLDLGTTRVIRTLEFPLQDRYLDLGARVEIEISENGTDWTSVWNDWTGGLAVAGALEDQRVVPVRFVLPDVTARYLRVHPMTEWMVQELRVLGP